MTGRFHTCYSPVRRSPAGRTSPSPAAPRLACVKPVASVHPEPGSNSSLLSISYFFFFQKTKYRPSFSVCLFCKMGFIFRKPSRLVLTSSLSFTFINACCCVEIDRELFFRFLPLDSSGGSSSLVLLRYCCNYFNVLVVLSFGIRFRNSLQS